MQWCHWWWCQQCMIPVLVPMACHDQKRHFAPHLNCLNVRNTVVPLTVLFGLRWCLCQWHCMNQKVILHIISVVLSWEMQWFHLCCCLLHVMLTFGPMTLHDQEGQVAPHFNCLDLWNAMVPLMMLLALCDGEANGGLWIKEIMLHVIYFVFHYGKQWCNLWCCWYHVTLILIPMTSYDTNTSDIYVTWPEKAMLHLILIVLMYRLYWWHWKCRQLYVMPRSVPVGWQDKK